MRVKHKGNLTSNHSADANMQEAKQHKKSQIVFNATTRALSEKDFEIINSQRDKKVVEYSAGCASI